jgi:hypothetical protein
MKEFSSDNCKSFCGIKRLAFAEAKVGCKEPPSWPGSPSVHTEFSAKFKEILTVLIGVLAATKPSQVTSQIVSNDEMDSDSEHKDMLYKPAFNIMASEFWGEHHCLSYLRNLGDVISLMGCIYQLRQVADEY